MRHFLAKTHRSLAGRERVHSASAALALQLQTCCHSPIHHPRMAAHARTAWSRLFAAGKQFGVWYDVQLQARPVLTKSATSGVLFMLGDGLSQTIEGGGLDGARLVRMGIWGSMFGVLAHGWYHMLEKIVSAPGRMGAVYRVLWDQVRGMSACGIHFPRSRRSPRAQLDPRLAARTALMPRAVDMDARHQYCVLRCWRHASHR